MAEKCNICHPSSVIHHLSSSVIISHVSSIVCHHHLSSVIRFWWVWSWGVYLVRLLLFCPLLVSSTLFRLLLFRLLLLLYISIFMLVMHCQYFYGTWISCTNAITKNQPIHLQHWDIQLRYSLLHQICPLSFLPSSSCLAPSHCSVYPLQQVGECWLPYDTSVLNSSTN